MKRHFKLWRRRDWQTAESLLGREHAAKQIGNILFDNRVEKWKKVLTSQNKHVIFLTIQQGSSRHLTKMGLKTSKRYDKYPDQMKWQDLL